MRTKKSVRQQYIELYLGEPKVDGLLRIWHFCCLTPVWHFYRLRSWLSQSLNILLQEIRSLFGRIAIRYQGEISPVVGFGWEPLATQPLVPCARTQARSL